MRTVAGPCLQSCTSKLQAAGPSCPAESTESCWSPFTLSRLRARNRGRDPIIAAPYLHFAQLQSKYKWERKTWKKHSFSDGKRFNDFVLLRCFIDFQTTLVDSRNLVIFSTFWYFLHAYLVIALQNIWSHWEDDRIQRKIWNEVMEDLEHQGRFGYVPVATKMPHNPPNKRKWVQWFST